MIYLKNIQESEEKWNVITHFLGIVFGIIGFPILFWKTINQELYTHQFAVTIYGISFLFLFFSSTIYHYTQKLSTKAIWRKIDHISIYFMISGSYVPFMLEYVSLNKAIIFLSIMYTLVFLGTIFKIFFTGRFEKMSLFLYIFLGWMILFMAKSFFGNASYIVSGLVMIGGIAYMIGIFFYTKDHKQYYHTIWHIFVLLGSIFHFLAVYNI